MSARTAPPGYVWVSCSRETDAVFYRDRHLIPQEQLRAGFSDTVCGATGSGEGVFRRDNRKPYCERCLMFSAGFAAARRGR